MKDIPMFTTDTGVSTLLLKEVPCKAIAYIRVQDIQPGGLSGHLAECVQFCRMCGAERIFAAGHGDLEGYPLHCGVNIMSMPTDFAPEGSLFPVTEATVSRWRAIYNEKMKAVDNAATLMAFDEKEILAGDAYFVHDSGDLLGIGWLRGGELLAVAAAKPGAGEPTLKTLLTAAGTDRVTLEVASTNQRAIRLYERLGGITIGERVRWYRVFG